MVSLPAAAAPHRMPRFLPPSKRGDTNWYRPPKTRYGAHVASQRCTILRSGKAIILSQNAQLMATPKTQIVLDMGYTLECDNSKPLLYIGIKRRSRLIQATTDITWENFDHQGLLSHWGAVLRNTSVLGVWMKPGIYTWLLIMITMYTLYKKRYQRLTALLPLWCVLLGCLCSPVNGYYRYMLPIIWTTPLIIPSVMCFK